MNNTATRTLAATVLIFTAITLVAGGTLAAATTSTAFAYQNKGTQYDGKGNNGNTNTIQALKQNAKESRKFSIVEQNGENSICTHPSSSSEDLVGTNVTIVPGEAGTCTSQSNQPLEVS